MSRNDAPVSLEVSLKHRSVEAQPPQKTPSKRDTPADDIKTPTINPGPQAPTDKMVKDTWDHSRGSNESRMVPFPDRQKSPLLNPGTGEKSSRCKVSPRTKHGQAATAIKTVKETEKQVITKGDTRKVGDSRERIEMETESADRPQTKEKTVNSATDKEMEKIADASVKQSEKSELTLKSAEKTSPRSPNLPDPAEAPEKTSQLQAKDSQPHHATPPKVISIAELLRSQIKALESMLANSVADVTTQEPPATEMHKNVKEDGKRIPEAKTSNKKTEDIPLRNIKETLLEVYQQLQLDQVQRETHDAILAPVQASEEIPPVSGVDTGTTTESYNTQTVLCQETAAALVSDLPRSVGQETETPPPVKPVISAPGSNIPVIKHVKDKTDQDKDRELLTKSSPVIKDGIPTKSEISEKLLDQSKADELHVKKTMFLNVQKLPAENGSITHLPATEFNQQESVMVEDSPQTESIADLSPKASPLLKRRSRTSIPAATEQELASGARRKIPKEKTSPEQASEAPTPVDNQAQVHHPSTESPKFFSSPASLPSSPSLQKRSQLLQPAAAAGEQTPSLERHSPVLSRRKTQPENLTQSQNPSEETHIQQTEEKPATKRKHDPFKGRNSCTMCNNKRCTTVCPQSEPNQGENFSRLSQC